MSTRALCSVYASLYQKCLDGNKLTNIKKCDDYVFFLKASGCAYHYYDYFKLDNKLKLVDKKYHSER
tara:strand:- start:449 stop:649 length:201 start_codon:yes stop_codon:yes gene_type:complete